MYVFNIAPFVPLCYKHRLRKIFMITCLNWFASSLASMLCGECTLFAITIKTSNRSIYLSFICRHKESFIKCYFSTADNFYFILDSCHINSPQCLICYNSCIICILCIFGKWARRTNLQTGLFHPIYFVCFAFRILGKCAQDTQGEDGISI